MCYWLIYIEDKDEESNLNFLAKPFENMEKLHDWLEKKEKIVAIAITKSIYSEDC